MTNRRIITAVLIDEDENLPCEKSLVAKIDDIITEDDNQVTIQQIMVDYDIKESIADHNELRSSINNRTILERTGAEVPLQNITIKDLTWKITG